MKSEIQVAETHGKDRTVQFPRWILPLALIIFGFLLPYVFTSNYSIHVLVIICIYLMLTISYNMIVGFTGYLTLAHNTFFGIGAYVTAILTTIYRMHYISGVVAGVLLSALISALFGWILFRRLKGFTFSIVTLGLAITAYIITLNWTSLTRGPMGIPGIPRPHISFAGFNYTLASPKDFYYLGLVMVIGTIALSRWIATSRYGLALFGIRENEQLAETVGVDSFKYKLVIFIIASMVASLSGSFFTHYLSLASPEIFWTFWITALLAMVIVGGAGSNEIGVILATILLIVTPEALRVAQEFRELIYGFSLVVMIIFIPKGIGGWIERRLYLRRLRQWRSLKSEM